MKTHLIEHSSMRLDGLTARTAALARSLASDEQFDSHQSFIDALARVEATIERAPDDIHVVVVCTHGLEGTGTWLHMDDSSRDQRPEVLPHNLLARARGAVVVYMAVCWGGYPGVLRRFQHGERPWPTVIGALAPLTATEGNELQDEVLNVLHGQGLDEAELQNRVAAFNEKYRAQYGHPIARIACANGELSPRQGTAGIAWSLLRCEDDEPVDGPFEITRISATHVDVQFDFVKAAMPSGRLRLAKGTPLAVGDRFRFKAKRSPCGRYLQAVGDVEPA